MLAPGEAASEELNQLNGQAKPTHAHVHTHVHTHTHTRFYQLFSSRAVMRVAQLDVNPGVGLEGLEFGRKPLTERTLWYGAEQSPCWPEVMMEDLEDLLFKHGVNIVLAGHVALSA